MLVKMIQYKRCRLCWPLEFCSLQTQSHGAREEANHLRPSASAMNLVKWWCQNQCHHPRSAGLLPVYLFDMQSLLWRAWADLSWFYPWMKYDLKRSVYVDFAKPCMFGLLSLQLLAPVCWEKPGWKSDSGHSDDRRYVMTFKIENILAVDC